MGRRLQFIIYVPKGMRVADIDQIEKLPINVWEDQRIIDQLSYSEAKRKYGHFNAGKHGR